MTRSRTRKFLIRSAADMALFSSVLFFPWWTAALVAVAGSFVFRRYPEAFLAGMCIDALYGSRSVNVHGFSLFYSALFLFLWLFTVEAKKKVRYLN